MNHVLRFSKKLFTTSVVVMTIAWSMGVAALVPAGVSAAEACPSLTAGKLIKLKTGSAVWHLINKGGKVVAEAIPDYNTFLSWDLKDADVVKNVDSSCLENLEKNNIMTLRPGSYLVKLQDFSKVYVPEPNGSWRPIASAAVAEQLYGSKALTGVGNGGRLLDLATVYATAYKTGTDLTEGKPPVGLLYKTSDSPTVYWAGTDGKSYEVSGTLSANLTKQVATVAATVKATATMGTGTKTSAAVTDMGEIAVPQPTGGEVKVSLAASTAPAGTYVAKGAYNAEFAKFTFTAAGNARVDKVVVKRDGLGSDADLTALRLYDGGTQLGSDQSLNTVTHLATFNNLNWDLKAGETKTLTVTADTYASAAGTNDYVMLNAVELEGAGTVSGVPVSGNAIQYHSVAVGVLDVDANATPGATTIISGSTNQEVASFNFDTTAAEAFNITSLTFTNNGTINNDEVSNFVVKLGNDVLGTNPGTFASNGMVTVDFTKPWYLEASKSKNVSVYVDIKGGITVSKNLILQIAESKHVIAKGDSSKSQVVVTNDDAAVFAAESSATMTIGQGTLTVSMNTATTPVTAGLIDGVPHNKFAAYKFSAGSTEGAKVTRLRLTVSGSGVAAADLSNFELYTYDEITAKETMVGTAQSISGSYVTFEDTNDGLFTVQPGKTVVVHAYADVNTGADWTLNASVYIGDTNSNLIVKAIGTNSLDYIPASSVTLSGVGGTSTSVVNFTNSDQGTLVVSLDQSSPAATSVAEGVTDYDFAHYRLQATGEDVSVTQMVVRAYNTSGTGSTASTTNEFTNVELWDITDAAAPRQLGATVTAPSSGGVSTFSFTLTVPKDSYKVLKVLADIPTAAAGAGYLHFDVPGAGTVEDDISSTGAKSGIDLTETGSATGRTMTVAVPTVSATWGVTPAAQSVVSSAQNVHLATLNLTAGQFEDIRVASITVYADDASSIDDTSSADADITQLRLVSPDGTKSYGATKNLTSGTPDSVTFDGISNLSVPKGTTIQVYLRANISGSSGTYYFGTTATTQLTATGVTSGNSATVSGTGVSTAQAITGSATISFTKDASSPLTRLVALGSGGAGTEVSLLSLNADALYEDVDLTTLNFLYAPVSGSAEQSSFADNGAKLYVKRNNGTETLVGSTSLVSSTLAGTYFEAKFNLADGALRVGKDDTTVLTLKAVFNGIATGSGTTSAMSPFVQFGDGSLADTSTVTAKGVSSGSTLAASAINGSNTLSISGDQIVVYRSFPTVTFQNLSTTAMVNGVENEIFAFKVKADSKGAVALKQLKFDLDVVDNVGTVNNSIRVGSFKFFRGSTELTATVQLTSSTGRDIESDASAFATGTGQAFYVVWPGITEEQIPAGEERTYYVKATLTGFTTDADDDYIRVRMPNAQATSGEISQTNDTYYLSGQSSNGNTIQLDDTLVVLGSSTQTNTTTADLIWSDISADSHSAATGAMSGGTATSTGDWFNGYYVTNTPTNYASLVR